MNIKQKYYSLSKQAGIAPWLLAGGVGTGVGGLYGMGDEKSNYYSDALHPATYNNAMAGGLGGLAGLGAYKGLRGLGQGRVGSGLAGLLAGGLTSYLMAPTKKEGFNPHSLYLRE